MIPRKGKKKQPIHNEKRTEREDRHAYRHRDRHRREKERQILYSVSWPLKKTSFFEAYLQ